MPGRQRRQRQAVPIQRLAEGHRVRWPRAEALLIERRGGRRAIGQFVPAHVIGVCVRDESLRLTVADVNREVDTRDLQPAVEVEHGCSNRPDATGAGPEQFRPAAATYFSAVATSALATPGSSASSAAEARLMIDSRVWPLNWPGFG